MINSCLTNTRSFHARLGRRLAHANQSLHAHHPVAALFDFVRVHVHLDFAGTLEVPALQSSSQFADLRDGVWLQEILVVEVVKQDIESLLRVNNLSLERGGCSSFHTCHLRGQDFEDWLCRWRDVRSVAFGCNID